MTQIHSPKRAVHEIDAAGNSLGRVASDVIKFLRGKHKPDFTPHIDNGDLVVVINAQQLKFTGRKLAQKDYYRHSMYPGGLKRTPMAHVFEQDPRKVVIHAVYGMLPKNRHRDILIQRLTVKP